MFFFCRFNQHNNHRCRKLKVSWMFIAWFIKKQILHLDVRIDKVMLALWFICQDVYKYLAILFIVTIYCYFMVVHDLFFLKQLSIFYNLILIHVLLLALSIQSYLSCCSIINVPLLPFCLGNLKRRFSNLITLKIYEER